MPSNDWFATCAKRVSWDSVCFAAPTGAPCFCNLSLYKSLYSISSCARVFYLVSEFFYLKVETFSHLTQPSTCYCWLYQQPQSAPLPSCVRYLPLSAVPASVLRLSMEAVQWRVESRWLCGPSRELLSLTTAQESCARRQATLMHLLQFYTFMVNTLVTLYIKVLMISISSF